jgi:hypothetical protein
MLMPDVRNVPMTRVPFRYGGTVLPHPINQIVLLR